MNTLEHLVANMTIGRAQRRTLRGREYLVAPMTMIVPGVLNGSDGPIYYSPEENAKSVNAWNHVPITVYHPNVEGQHVSARHGDVLDKQGIGVVMQSRIADEGKLQANGWFDVERTKAVDPWVYDCLTTGKPFELSTGLYTRKIKADPGSAHRGKSYDYIATNYRPDHLAVLPNQTGACSLRDGCGVLVNAKPGRQLVGGKEMTRKDHARVARRHAKAADTYRQRASLHEKMAEDHAVKSCGIADVLTPN
jgi:hypothetical protein